MGCNGFELINYHVGIVCNILNCTCEGRKWYVYRTVGILISAFSGRFLSQYVV